MSDPVQYPRPDCPVSDSLEAALAELDAAAAQALRNLDALSALVGRV